ncbi:SDR family NAD(P)-dependent oxidoreductase [Ruminococcus sp. JL13D9]|jgi:short-subunit dehydrogenase|uniref:SDR family NAD(P)-dependent oxidoreductase n=1 Tax=Ruminococcus sp. JL13D9 TaxID=3233381 RepID=UPI00389B2525
MKALITGASSGIGREFALYLAELGYDLIICSRSTDKLNALKDEIKNVSVRVITIDLSRESDAFDLYEHLKEEDIDVLINNAGFGAFGKFLNVPLEREVELIHTNVSSVHILTKCFLKDMQSKNSGLILNVGSMAGFSAGPKLSSYYASKNYVVRLTQAINEELRRDGSKVKISVLCPGPVETNFNNVANVRFTTKGLNARDVARYAFDKARQGKIIIIPGFLMKTVKFFEHFLPENLLTRISYNVQSKKEGK